MTEPLKPCPFCGQNNTRIEVTEPHGAYVVECACGARGPDAPCRTHRANSQESYVAMTKEASERAVRMWNTRVRTMPAMGDD